MLNGRTATVLALAAAVAATNLALPGGGVPLLILAALAPLAWLAWRTTPLRAAGLTYLYGLLGWGLAIRGWAEAAEAMFGFSPIAAHAATLALAAVQAVPFALAGWLAAMIGRASSPAGAWQRVLGFAAAGTVSLSWLPGVLPGNPAHALQGEPAAVQLLALGGTPLLLFAILLVNALLAEAARQRSGRALLRAVLLAGVIGAGGALRLAAADAPAGTPLRIAGIQPAIGLGAHAAFMFPDDRARAMAHLSAMTAAAAAQEPRPDLIVWSETPLTIAPDQEPAIHAWLGGLARQVGRPILVPGSARSTFVYQNGVAGYLNRAWLYDAQGAIGGHHDKARLVPFAEYLPLEGVFPWVRQLVPFPRHMVASPSATPLEIGGGIRAIVAICYEAIFPDEMRAQARAGGTIILNPVNDLWFGDSRIGAFHLALAAFRAVELGIPIARVTNSGQTAFFDRYGRAVGDHPDAGRPAIATALLSPARADTPYARYGDVVLWLLTAGLALTVIAIARSHGSNGRRRPCPPGRHGLE